MRQRGYILGAGFMPDYACSAKCRHCLYGCSNTGSREYVSKENALRIMEKLRDAGVDSLHVGGGEPFLSYEGLKNVLEAMRRYGIAVDYIETNAFWCVDRKMASERFRELMELGADTIMASCDPFHIEYVPLERVVTFAEAAQDAGIGWFIWKEQFFRRLSRLDIHKTHSREELEEAFGKDYLKETAKEYGIGMNGRALNLARTIYPLKPAFEAASDKPCERMLMGHHCHIDLYGNVVPAGCTGIAISIDDFVSRREELYDVGKHPVTGRLLKGGTKELLAYAVSLGFDDKTPAATNCDLCYKIRCFLREAMPTEDIGPDVFYEMMES
ncbi:MAG: radical SAM protein [Lachnospiraceae bacterium]|nr:radical SAM protein [Lachnospiraceae bacterium]